MPANFFSIVRVASLKWRVRFLALVLLLCLFYPAYKALERYTDNLIARLISELIHTESNGLYKVSFGDIRFSVLTGKLLLYDFKLEASERAVEEGLPNIYEAAVPEMFLQIDDIPAVYLNKELIISSVKLTEPYFVMDNYPAETALTFSRETGNLYTLISQYLQLFEITQLEVEDATVQWVNHSGEEEKSYTVKDISFAFRNFQVKAGRKTSRDKFFYTDAIELAIKNQEIRLPDSIHVFTFDKLEIVTDSAFIRIKNFKLYPDPSARLGQSNIYSIAVPDLKLSGIDFPRLYHDNHLTIESIVLESPAIRISTMPENRRSTPRLPGNKFSHTLSYFLDQLHIGRFTLNSASLSLSSARKPYLEAASINLTINQLGLDSAIFSERLDYLPEYESFSLNFRDNTVIINQGAYTLTAEELGLSSAQGILTAHNFRLSIADSAWFFVPGIRQLSLSNLNISQVRFREALADGFWEAGHMYLSGLQVSSSPAFVGWLADAYQQKKHKVVEGGAFFSGFSLAQLSIRQGVFKVQAPTGAEPELILSGVNLQTSPLQLGVHPRRELPARWQLVKQLEVGYGHSHSPRWPFQFMFKNARWTQTGGMFSADQFLFTTSDGADFKVSLNATSFQLAGFRPELMIEQRKLSYDLLQCDDAKIDIVQGGSLDAVNSLLSIEGKQTLIENISLKMEANKKMKLSLNEGFLYAERLDWLHNGRQAGWNAASLKARAGNIAYSKDNQEILLANFEVSSLERKLKIEHLKLRQTPHSPQHDSLQLHTRLVEASDIDVLALLRMEALSLGSLRISDADLRALFLEEQAAIAVSLPLSIDNLYLDNVTLNIAEPPNNFTVDAHIANMEMLHIQWQPASGKPAYWQQWLANMALLHTRHVRMGRHTSFLNWKELSLSKADSSLSLLGFAFTPDVTTESASGMEIDSMAVSGLGWQFTDSLRLKAARYYVQRPRLYSPDFGTMAFASRRSWPVARVEADSIQIDNAVWQQPYLKGLDAVNISASGFGWTPNSGSPRLQGGAQMQTTGVRFMFPDSTYQLSFQDINFSDTTWVLSDVYIRPASEKEQFFDKQSFQADYVDIHIPALVLANPVLDTHLAKSYFSASHIRADSFMMFIDRNRSFPEQNDYKPMLHQVIEKMPFYIAIDSVSTNGSTLVYTEIQPDTTLSAYLSLHHINAQLKHLYNTPERQLPDMQLVGSTSIMAAGQLRVKINFLRNDSLGTHTIEAEFGEMEASSLNPILEPAVFLKIQSGQVHGAKMNAILNNKFATGSMTLRYANLRISLVNKRNNRPSSGLGNRIAGLFANMIVRNSNPPARLLSPRQGEVFFQRVQHKSIFNYWVKTSLSGLLSNVGVRKNYQAELKEMEKARKQVQEARRMKRQEAKADEI